MGLFGHMRIHVSGTDRSLDRPSTSSISTMPSSIQTPSPSTPNTIGSSTTVTSSETDTADFSCSHCLRTFTSHIDLVGHLRILRTEAGGPVPGASTYTRCIHLNCPHCTRTLTHRMGLLGHVHIHENLR
ncbi:hypothetical protein SprV_0301279900 [Sparganum proliferum]